ncbi:tetratricopeptide repeat protein [Marivirga lumbricoides]|uniref:tetratricopeptide repeat protein n=1 Tax=Marivirga lumbricoides TaxID=1046115 RepID=UPI001663A822
MKSLLPGILILCLLVSNVLHGQNKATIDSLKKSLSKDKTAQNIQLYNQIAWEYRKSHPDSTIFYSQIALDVASQEEYQLYKAQPLNFLGVGYYYLGENLKAYEYYSQAKDVALSNGDSLQYGHALNNIGRIYFNQGNYISAYNYFMRSMEVFEETEDKTAISYGYKSLSELYQSQNNLEKALEMSMKTAEIRKSFNDPSGIISIYLEIASIYISMKDYNSALSYFTKAYDIAENINDEANLAIIKLEIAKLNTQRGHLGIALLNAIDALNFAEKSNNNNLLIKVNYQMGLIYYTQNNFNRAKIYFEKVKKQASENNDIVYERDALLFLAKIYENEGMVEEAYNNFKLFANMKEKTDNIEAAREIQKLESRLEIEVTEKENQLLKSNESAYKAVIEKQRALSIALSVIASLVVLLLIIIWSTARKRQKFNKILVNKNEEIEAHQLKITAQNEEIKKQNDKLTIHNKTLDDLNNEKDSLLGIVVHDLKLPFSRIIGLTDLLKYTKLSIEQEQYVQMIRTNSKHGSYLINDLLDVNAMEIDKSKPVPTNINLKTLLENQGANFVVEIANKELGLKIKCDPDLIVSTDKAFLNRILENLISNAIKFSHLGSEIILSAGKDSNSFWISVKDFGLGFTEEDQKTIFGKFKRLSARPTGGESSNGLGLAIVKTLTDRLNGKISLNSEKDKFSEFTLTFPMLD